MSDKDYNYLSVLSHVSNMVVVNCNWCSLIAISVEKYELKLLPDNIVAQHIPSVKKKS